MISFQLTPVSAGTGTASSTQLAATTAAPSQPATTTATTTTQIKQAQQAPSAGPQIPPSQIPDQPLQPVSETAAVKPEASAPPAPAKQTTIATQTTSQVLADPSSVDLSPMPIQPVTRPTDPIEETRIGVIQEIELLHQRLIRAAPTWLSRAISEDGKLTILNGYMGEWLILLSDAEAQISGSELTVAAVRDLVREFARIGQRILNSGNVDNPDTLRKFVELTRKWIAFIQALESNQVPADMMPTQPFTLPKS